MLGLLMYSMVSPFRLTVCCHHGRAITRVCSVYVMNTKQRLEAADLRTKPTGLSRKLG